MPELITWTTPAPTTTAQRHACYRCGYARPLVQKMTWGDARNAIPFAVGIHQRFAETEEKAQESRNHQKHLMSTRDEQKQMSKASHGVHEMSKGYRSDIVDQADLEDTLNRLSDSGYTIDSVQVMDGTRVLVVASMPDRHREWVEKKMDNLYGK